jgi:hypothetical protein
MNVRVRVYDPTMRLVRTDVLEMDKLWSLDYRAPTGWLAIGRIDVEPTDDDAQIGCWIHPVPGQAKPGPDWTCGEHCYRHDLG